MFPSYIENIRTKKRRRSIRVLLLVSALLIAAGLGWDIRSDIAGGGKTAEVGIDIPQGAGTRQVAQLLGDARLVKYPVVFRIVAKLTASEAGFQYGHHVLREDMSYAEIIRTVSKTTVATDVFNVTIIEGSEIRQTADKLAQAFAETGGTFDKAVFLSECDKGQFDFPFIADIKRTQNRLEGYLFPATYTFAKTATERDVIIAMLEKLQSVYTPAFAQRASEIGFTMDEVLTLASVVEREGASAEEFKTVSSVFHNRLDKSMKLESCATVQYILGERKAVLSNADTRIKSPYNTYINFGLPVGPIASAGEAAIRAALYPEQTDYLYFRLKDGKHYFAKTFREHLQNQ